MPMRKSRRRAVLAAIALALAGGNLWFFSRASASGGADFELGATGGTAYATPLEVSVAPHFDPLADTWETRDGRALAAPARGNGAGPFYLLVRLSAGLSADTARAGFLQLARRGICRVAIADGSERKGPDGRLRLPIVRIVAVRDRAGRRIACRSA